MAIHEPIQIESVSWRGVKVSSIFELLRELQKLPIPVKDELQEGHPPQDQGPRRFDDEQQAFLRSLRKEGTDFDPSYQESAMRKWSHLLQLEDVMNLRHTHHMISATFRHGSHKGQQVSDLSRKLKEGSVKSEQLTPLVCLKWNEVLWVICGNRRLKALQDYAKTRPGQGNAFYCPTKVKCIVHPDAGKAPPALIARFLLAWDTTNHGRSTTVRQCKRKQVAMDEGTREDPVDHSVSNPRAEAFKEAVPEPPALEDHPRFTSIPAASDEFYVRYYVGHKGRYGHEFLEFEFRQDGRLRYANNSNYKNYPMIRKECFVSQAVLMVLQGLVEESQIIETLEADGACFEQPDRNGRQELEIVHMKRSICLITNKDEFTPWKGGRHTFFRFIQHLKDLVFSLVGLHFRVKPL
eukprot:Skav211414  [mRNA]  locus=scaffold1608:80418:81641:+ [translate_table: standard]